MEQKQHEDERIIRIDELTRKVGLSRTTIWRRVKDNDLPRPIRLGGANTSAVGWRLSEIERWLIERETA